MTAKAATLSTEEFWERMCEPGFVRLSLNIGAIENMTYFTSNPPEEVDGFLARVMGDTLHALGVSR